MRGWIWYIIFRSLLGVRHGFWVILVWNRVYYWYEIGLYKNDRKYYCYNVQTHMIWRERENNCRQMSTEKVQILDKTKIIPTF